jgi:hypothetical protein
LSTSPSMVLANVPAGHRCKGAPLSGWGGLGSGLSSEACQDACLADPMCKFAVYKQDNQKCSSFEFCSETIEQSGFTVWAKTHVPSSTTSSQATTSTTPASTATSITSTTAPLSCPREEQITACVLQKGEFVCKPCVDEANSAPCCSCQGGEPPSPAPTTATTTLAPGSCKDWCEDSSKPWQKKCTWSGCSGCIACGSRRLRGNELLPPMLV